MKQWVKKAVAQSSLTAQETIKPTVDERTRLHNQQVRQSLEAMQRRSQVKNDQLFHQLLMNGRKIKDMVV